MQHLDSERLASFDHEPASPAELAHLEGCAECRAERDAYTLLSELVTNVSTGLPTESANDQGAPLTDWNTLSARLRLEGLIRPASDATPPLRTSLSLASPSRTLESRMSRLHASGPRNLRRIAAALVLVAGGAWLGRFSASASPGPVSTSVATSASGADVSSISLLRDPQDFTSVEEATRVLTLAQRDYERASLWLASNDTTIRSPGVFRARLAALDQMMAASRAALREAPQDPILNHYYMTAYTAREATLQQLVSSLPVDKTIEGF